MTDLDDLRLIGTGYYGKEPFEYTADVLRSVLRRDGGDLGFEACLTSRPFTAVTFRPDQPGAMAFGRGDFGSAARAAADLADGLDALAGAGFHVEPLDPAELARPGMLEPHRMLIAGPLPVPGRWAPPMDRLLFGETWRHVIIDTEAAEPDTRVRPPNSVICLDPVVGGYTAIGHDEFTREGVTVQVVVPPGGALDVVFLARHCLVRGACWRSAAVGSDRDEQGLSQAAAHAETLVVGGAMRRLRYSLAAYVLHALRSGAMLGSCGPLTTNELVLADLLSEVVTGGRAVAAALGGPADALARALRRLATTVAAITELYDRITAAAS